MDVVSKQTIIHLDCQVQFPGNNASPDPRSLRKLITQQRDWVMLAEARMGHFRSRRLNFRNRVMGLE